MLKNFLSLAFKYIVHSLSAKSKKGHGIHSPFVFDLCTHVFSKKTKEIKEIEKCRKKLLSSVEKISFHDIGAGSSVDNKKIRKIKEIARYSSNKKINKLMFKLVSHLKPTTIIEFGTSFAFSTMYMAKANSKTKIISIEGIPEIASVAKRNMSELDIKNVQIIESSFDNYLENVPSKIQGKTLVFLDGNHKKEATLKYFFYVIKHIPEDSVIVIYDINWSAGMNEAWEEIKKSEQFELSIDLFFVGLVFKRVGIYKQNFKIRF